MVNKKGVKQCSEVWEIIHIWVLVSFPVAVIQFPGEINLGKKGFVWITIRGYSPFCGKVKAAGT